MQTAAQRAASKAICKLQQYLLIVYRFFDNLSLRFFTFFGTLSMRLSLFSYGQRSLITHENQELLCKFQGAYRFYSLLVGFLVGFDVLRRPPSTIMQHCSLNPLIFFFFPRFLTVIVFIALVIIA